MLHWLSFCDPDKPTGTQFLGACIVEADNFGDAIVIAHILKINLGGEVKGCKFICGDTLTVPLEYMNRLLSKDDIDKFDIFIQTNGGRKS